MNITIKERAEAMLNSKLAAGQFLRVVVKEGGCAGLTYDAAIASEMHRRARAWSIQQGRSVL